MAADVPKLIRAGGLACLLVAWYLDVAEVTPRRDSEKTTIDLAWRNLGDLEREFTERHLARSLREPDAAGDDPIARRTLLWRSPSWRSYWVRWAMSVEGKLLAVYEDALDNHPEPEELKRQYEDGIKGRVLRAQARWYPSLDAATRLALKVLASRPPPLVDQGAQVLDISIVVPEHVYIDANRLSYMEALGVEREYDAAFVATKTVLGSVVKARSDAVRYSVGRYQGYFLIGTAMVLLAEFADYWFTRASSAAATPPQPVPATERPARGRRRGIRTPRPTRLRRGDGGRRRRLLRSMPPPAGSWLTRQMRALRRLTGGRVGD